MSFCDMFYVIESSREIEDYTDINAMSIRGVSCHAVHLFAFLAYLLPTFTMICFLRWLAYLLVLMWWPPETASCVLCF